MLNISRGQDMDLRRAKLLLVATDPVTLNLSASC